MLHELLLALNGYPGSVFVKNGDGEIQVLAEIPHLHTTEVALLNRLCKLATYYSNFISFIRRHGPVPGGGSKQGIHGLYLRSFCQGLDEVLKPYRHALLDIEKELLSDPHLSAAHVQSRLEEYQLLFPALNSVLDQISSQRAHGCHNLEILHKASACGVPVAKAAIQKILHVCHGVLFKQLAAWMLHGLLLDNYGEFFIHRVQAGTAPKVEDVDDELGLGGITGPQMRKMMRIADVVDSGAYERFALRAEMLPSYIPPRVADKILFVGESVQMFETEKTGSKHKHRGSILQNREDAFAKELHQLSQQKEFNLMVFDVVVDKIRGFAAQQLRQLIVEEADLPSQLRVLKDFFLLGRGELFLAFIDQVKPLLKGQPVPTTQHDVNMGFQHAARNVLLEDEGTLQSFNFSIDSKYLQQQPNKRTQSNLQLADAQGYIPVDNGWAVLDLNFSVEWPLHVLFTPGVLERYNTMFKFLLHVKRIQLELQQCWAHQMRTKHHFTDGGTTKWWLRNHMAFLVDNLQYYLQVDVIESQFSILLEKINTTQDFEEIRLAHDNFLTSLLSQSFLLTKPIAHCLSEILTLCRLFCQLMNENITGGQSSQKLDYITKNFQRQSSLLFKILSSVRNHQSSPHLAQLLLRVDYNKYYSHAGGQLGSNVTLPVETLLP